MSGETRPNEPQIWDVAAMSKRLVRYEDLRPCYNAFIDTRTPGSQAKENFTIIGPGVSENPEQFVHIAEPHGFNIGGARQPPNCVNSQHSHDTAEVFLVHSGTWRFDLGEHGEDAQIVIEVGDVISLPTKMFRGFTNIGDDVGFLFAVLGGDDPGKVLWAPKVFDLAAEHGLVLLETGQLIDQVAGQTVPEDATIMPATTLQQVAALTRATSKTSEDLVWRAEEPCGMLPILGVGTPIDWQHGFTIDRFCLSSSMTIESDGRPVPCVIFVHAGELIVVWDDGELVLGAGDTMSLPIGVDFEFSSPSSCTYYSVDGQ